MIYNYCDTTFIAIIIYVERIDGTYMEPGFLRDIRPMYVRELTEAEPVNTRRVCVSIYDYFWWACYNFKHFTNLQAEKETVKIVA